MDCMKNLGRLFGLGVLCTTCGFFGAFLGTLGQSEQAPEPVSTAQPAEPVDLSVVEGALLELDERLAKVEERGLSTRCARDGSVQVVTDYADGFAYRGAICLESEWPY